MTCIVKGSTSSDKSHSGSLSNQLFPSVQRRFLAYFSSLSFFYFLQIFDLKPLIMKQQIRNSWVGTLKKLNACMMKR